MLAIQCDKYNWLILYYTYFQNLYITVDNINIACDGGYIEVFSGGSTSLLIDTICGDNINRIIMPGSGSLIIFKNLGKENYTYQFQLMWTSMNKGKI